MPLTPGTKLGQYEVVEAIGAGGMGEVYRARDTKLGRDVAIKVLPEEFARDKERLDRFEREARLLAQLNHANIATLHGLEEHDGQKFIVMELVEGETLAERISKGPVPIDEAIPIFIQIAEGLEAAHEKAIIHRDLKPANIKIGPDGKPKILDFGLAKAFVGEDGTATDSSQSPTLTKGTALGVIMGTPSYMSPEQARGKPVDKRADIWAYGCCLYESLVGRRAFEGDNVTDVLAAVVGKEPGLSELPDNIPCQIPRLVRRCLTKDPRERTLDIGVARQELEEASAAEPVAVNDTPRASTLSRFSVAFTLAALAGVVGWNLAHEPSEERVVTRSAILFDNDIRLTSATPPGMGTRGRDTSIAISDDGSEIFFVGERDGQRLVFRRALERLEVEPVRGTEGARAVFLSPDGQWLGFAADNELKKVRLNGEPPVTFYSGNPYAATWGPNDTVVFTEFDDLWEIASAGGEPRRLTSGGRFTSPPSFVPEGGALLASDSVSGEVVVISMASGEATALTNGIGPRYVPSGHVVFRRDTSLWAMPFDLGQLKATGSAVQVLPADIPQGVMPNFALSLSGTLAYTPSDYSSRLQQLVWVDREGDEEVLPLEPSAYRIPRISTDQSRIVYDACCPEMNPPIGDIWMYDLGGANPTRLTFEPIGEFHPLWAPDDERVVFYSYGRSMDWKTSTGIGEQARLLEATVAVPLSFTPDGRTLIYGDMQDIHMLRLDGDRIPETLLGSPDNEFGAFVSPDGRWLAYASEETGRSEIFVRPFPNVDDGLWQVSANGGSEASWAHDGSELFYRDNEKMMVVEVATTSPFSHRPPRVLFEGHYDTHEQRAYDVARDGRFLMVKDVTPTGPASEGMYLVLIQNWFEELERLVPTN